MSTYYLYFRKKDYADPANFQFPRNGITVYCAQTDKIYRCDSGNESPDYHLQVPKLDYLTPPVAVEKSKLIYFAYSSDKIINPHTRRHLVEKKSFFDKNLTDDEFVKALKAFDRYAANQVRSLAWPIQLPKKKFDLWDVVMMSGGSNRTSQQDLLPPPPPPTGREESPWRIYAMGSWSRSSTCSRSSADIRAIA